MERLMWGLSNEVPENARAAWGCRAIAKVRMERKEKRVKGRRVVEYNRFASIDVPYDRKDFVGSDKDRPVLRRWLEENMEGIWDDAKRLMAEGKIQGDRSETVTLFEDDSVKAVCSTNASHGYLYVAVWLKGDA